MNKENRRLSIFDLNHNALNDYSYPTMTTFTLASENCHMYGSESCVFRLSNHFHFILSFNIFKKTLTMRIVLVADTYSANNNGTTMSARNLVHELKKQGHEVRVVTTGPEGEGLYICRAFEKGLIPTLARWQGITLSRGDKDVIRRAIEGADVVHCYFPFVLARATAKVCAEAGVPCTAAFHCQPEDITYNIGMSSCGFMAECFYWALREYFFKHIRYIHCPSEFIAGELQRTGYKAQLRVVSNGVNEIFQPRSVAKLPQLKNKFCIMMVGRLSKEKRQDVLIKACALSKHANEIQLILAGHGPKEAKYRRMAEKLPNQAIFGFYSQEDLVNLLNMCDLYVHAADVEIEAISCLEAISCGLVPVISNCRTSATQQFALYSNSLFKSGDAQDCADKIDYWIEHPEERRLAGIEYAKSSQKYKLSSCVNQMIDFFQEAIDDNNNRMRSV